MRVSSVPKNKYEILLFPKETVSIKDCEVTNPYNHSVKLWIEEKGGQEDLKEQKER